MIKIWFLFLLSCFYLCAISQPNKPLQGYVALQYTRTLEDITKGNNPWGIGGGFQLHWRPTKFIQAVGEVSGDLYLEDDKVGRSGPGGQLLPEVGSISKLLIGPALRISPCVNAAVTCGPSFTGGRAYFTLKPALHLFLNKRQSAFAKAAYIHVNNRGSTIREDFISYSIAIGVKAF